MQRTRFDNRECPVAQALELIGEWWSLLIIRDAFRGLRRFEDFQASLGIARNMLSRRLKALVAAGLLEKRPYSERPPRHEYRLTVKGRELMPVLVSLLVWGNRWTAPAAGPTTLLVDRATGEPIEPHLSLAGLPLPGYPPRDPRRLRAHPRRFKLAWPLFGAGPRLLCRLLCNDHKNWQTSS
jgi:DNA-binding HxlR family transcriptional regulator